MPKQIYNLTQHPPTPEQLAAGVSEPEKEEKELIKLLLTFEDIPTKADLYQRASALAGSVLNHGFKNAMIGGAPFFMSTLERVFKENGITPLYAFSKRESVEEMQADGTIKKTQIFKHLGWVEV